MDIPTPPSSTTRPTTTTAETQAPRTTAASAYRGSAYQTPQANVQTQNQQQPPPPSGDASMPDQITPPMPLAPTPCPACAAPSHWPWIIALLVGGGLGWYMGSRKKSSKAQRS